jgi:hypothetical protein
VQGTASSRAQAVPSPRRHGEAAGMKRPDPPPPQRHGEAAEGRTANAAGNCIITRNVCPQAMNNREPNEKEQMSVAMKVKEEMTTVGKLHGVQSNEPPYQSSNQSTTMSNDNAQENPAIKVDTPDHDNATTSEP